MPTRRKNFDKSFYKNYTIKNSNLDEVGKILNKYISYHKIKFDFNLVNCEFLIEFDNQFAPKIQSNYFYNTNDIIHKIKS